MPTSHSPSFASSPRRCAKRPTARPRSKALNPGQQVVSIVHEELVEILGGATRELTFAESGPTVFMLAGLQGAGKTTLAGKLGKWLREEGKTVLLVASDLQRPKRRPAAPGCRRACRRQGLGTRAR